MCEECNDTGWVGDNGPGISGNNEYEPRSLCKQKPQKQGQAGIDWEKRYSLSLHNDKQGRWMRIGRINGMTVAIITKANDKFLVRVPNNKGDESLVNGIIATSEQEAMLKGKEYIAEYVSNFSA